MLNNREMVEFNKWDFFRFFSYTFTINYVTTGAREMPIDYIFCFICSEKFITNISMRKNVGLFSSVFKKMIPLLFKTWLRKLNPHNLSKT